MHRQICQFNESPILVKLDPLMRQSETVPVKCYESVIDIVEGNATMLLVELTYSLVTEVNLHLIYSRLVRNMECHITHLNKNHEFADEFVKLGVRTENQFNRPSQAYIHINLIILLSLCLHRPNTSYLWQVECCDMFLVHSCATKS